jgi:ABC-type transport system involved in multi-copper enzyme maturation permease subunit
MTVSTPAARPAPARPALRRPDRFRPLFLDLAYSEWTKLRTVRSTYWTLLVTALGMVAAGVALSGAYAKHYQSLGPAAKAAFNPAAYSLSGFFIGQLAIGTLGVVIITSEYTTGSIRSTLAAVPQRGMVFAAKATVFTLIAAVIGIVSSFGAFFLGQSFLSKQGLETHLGAPGTLRSVIGAGLYLAVVGLLAFGLGTLIRRTAGAIAVFVGLLLVVPIFFQALPSASQSALTKYLPSDAGQALIGRTKFAPSSSLLAPWAGFAVFCGYTAIILIAAFIALSRRDS